MKKLYIYLLLLFLASKFLFSEVDSCTTEFIKNLVLKYKLQSENYQNKAYSLLMHDLNEISKTIKNDPKSYYSFPPQYQSIYKSLFINDSFYINKIELKIIPLLKLDYIARNETFESGFLKFVNLDTINFSSINIFCINDSIIIEYENNECNCSEGNDPDFCNDFDPFWGISFFKLLSYNQKKIFDSSILKNNNLIFILFGLEWFEIKNSKIYKFDEFSSVENLENKYNTNIDSLNSLTMNTEINDLNAYIYANNDIYKKESLRHYARYHPIGGIPWWRFWDWRFWSKISF